MFIYFTGPETSSHRGQASFPVAIFITDLLASANVGSPATFIMLNATGQFQLYHATYHRFKKPANNTTMATFTAAKKVTAKC